MRVKMVVPTAKFISTCLTCFFLVACMGENKYMNEQTENNKGIEAQLLGVESHANKLDAELVLTNHSAYRVEIVKWLTGVDGIQDDILKVMYKGGQLPYIGPRIKRAEPSAADYLVLEPGQTFASEIDLTKFYDLTEPGQYSIKYSIDLMLDINYSVDVKNPPEAIKRLVLESDVLDITIP